MAQERMPTEADARYLRRAIEGAAASRAAGGRPFCSLVVLDGEVIAESQSIRAGNVDPTNHSEMRVLREASATRPAQVLGRATLYASTEPCAMCAGAAYWAGVGRVVFGLSEARLRALTGTHPWNPTLALPCRELFARGSRAIEVIGPFLEDEAAVPHSGYWDTATR